MMVTSVDPYSNIGACDYQHHPILDATMLSALSNPLHSLQFLPYSHSEKASSYRFSIDMKGISNLFKDSRINFMMK